MRNALNYLGQLRLYSAADLCLLLAYLDPGTRNAVGGLLLWFGFLVYLEWRHRDAGRLRWPPVVWVVLWTVGATATATPRVLAFLAFAAAYGEKKRITSLAPMSWIVNGGVKLTLVWVVAPDLPGTELALIWGLMATRNLMGDLRDIHKDRSEGVRSLPVAVGMKHDHWWPYPAALAATSVIWWAAGDLPIIWLVAALTVEAGTYRLTPR